MDVGVEKVAKEGLTYNDVLLIPGKSEVLPKEVDLTTRLTRRIQLNIPLVSAAMDTVTEARLAIAIAQDGGRRTRQGLGIHPPEPQSRSVHRSAAGAIAHR